MWWFDAGLDARTWMAVLVVSAVGWLGLLGLGAFLTRRLPWYGRVPVWAYLIGSGIWGTDGVIVVAVAGARVGSPLTASSLPEFFVVFLLGALLWPYIAYFDYAMRASPGGR